MNPIRLISGKLKLASYLRFCRRKYNKIRVRFAGMTSSKRLSIFLSAILFCSLVPSLSSVAAVELYDYDLDGEIISQGQSLDYNLGSLNAGEMVSISFFASDSLDAVILTDSQYNNWNGQEYIKNGSEIDSSIAIYTWTVESSGAYWVVIDNSGDVSNGANSGQEVTISSGYIDISDSVFGEYKSRLFIEPNSYFHFDFGASAQGDILHMSISCDNWIEQDLDVFLVQEMNRENFLSGQNTWDRNATILDSCLEIWDFELTENGNWHIFIENGPLGDSPTDSDGILVDVFFFNYEKLPTIIQSTTRMIENSDVWRVDLGNLDQNEILSFTLSITNELFAEIDVLVMESTEADKYITGQQATVLGHASLINTASLDSWDYTFPDAGEYSLIIDNSESPEGGATEDKGLQVKISVQEVTILGDWIGWYQSRHYVEDGNFVSFDLGNLNSGDEIYYTVSGTSFGSGFLNSFDMMVMTDEQYNIYSSGGNPELIEEASDLDTWISIFQNYTIESSDRYWVVIDAADGPTNGADSNGAWSFDYIIKSSRNQITSPQMKDSNYQMIATHPEGTNLVDQIDDSTDNGQDNDDSNSDNQQSGETNIGDAQAKSNGDSGGSGSAVAGLFVVAVIVFVIRKRRRNRSPTDSNNGFENPETIGSNNMTSIVESHQTTNQSMSTNNAGTVVAETSTRPNPPVGLEFPPTNETGYLGADGFYWLEWPSGSGTYYYRTENGVWTAMENKPSNAETGNVDANGYEWIVHSDGTNWYRLAHTNGEWTKYNG